VSPRSWVQIPTHFIFIGNVPIEEKQRPSSSSILKFNDFVELGVFVTLLLLCPGWWRGAMSILTTSKLKTDKIKTRQRQKK
jgi:hypothetical protein